MTPHKTGIFDAGFFAVLQAKPQKVDITLSGSIGYIV